MFEFILFVALTYLFPISNCILPFTTINYLHTNLVTNHRCFAHGLHCALVQFSALLRPMVGTSRSLIPRQRIDIQHTIELYTYTCTFIMHFVM